MIIECIVDSQNPNQIMHKNKGIDIVIILIIQSFTPNSFALIYSREADPLVLTTLLAQNSYADNGQAFSGSTDRTTSAHYKCFIYACVGPYCNYWNDVSMRLLSLVSY